ncbi:phage portal protein [Pelagibacterium mangrovi]|uniref:phage portal protein n=1 Tax=Pelagibacterium mangrovi TaxID=3119828 RepID=UPI002FC8B811
MNLLQKMLAPFRAKSELTEQPRMLSLTNPRDWGIEPSFSGETVATQDVLALSTAWACVNLIAGTIGALPLMVYRTDEDGGRTVARDHSLYRLLHDSPNVHQTALDFLEFVSACIELQGNGLARKTRNAQRQVVALTPVAWDIVSVKRQTSGRLRYSWTENGQRFDLDQDDVLHVRGFGGGPLGGLSTLTYGRQTFGLAKAIERASGGTFANGMRPSVIIAYKEFLTQEQRDLVEGRLEEKYLGAVNAGRPFIAEGGMTVTPLSMKPEDAQMLQSRAFSVEEVCRFFGVPPHMVGHTEKATSWGTGLEQQTLGFQKFTLRRRLARIEQAMRKQLLTAEDRAAGVTIEFSLEGLLRGDSKARAEFYRGMSQIGAMTINEIRQLENLPPVEGGDVPRMQMQNVPITESGNEVNDNAQV